MNGQTTEEAGLYALDIIKEFIYGDSMYIMTHCRGEFSSITSYHREDGLASKHELQQDIVNSLCSLVVESKKAFTTSNLQMDAEASLIEQMTRYGVYSFVGVPIYTKGEVYGVLCIISGSTVLYERKDIKLLEGMAAIIGYVVELQEAAMKDGLTGLYNRSYIERINQQWMVQADKQPISLMYIDIDNFKTINDRYGHMTGDAVLRQLAERFKRIVGTQDIIIRMGGDEFILIIEACEKKGEERMLEVAQALLEQMHQPIQTAQGAIEASLSIGISCGSLEYMTIHELVQQADSAMYGVKRNGKGAYKLSEPQVIR